MKKLLGVIAVGLLAATPSIATAQLHTGVSLAGGLAAPSGALGNNYKSGYDLALGLNVGAPLVPFGLRLEGAYNTFDFKSPSVGTTGNRNIVSGTANGTFGFGLPYLIGGVGYYSTRTTTTSATTTINSDRQSAMGMNGGVGLRFPLGVISTFAEVRYHKMLGDAATGMDASYVPITFGINF